MGGKRPTISPWRIPSGPRIPNPDTAGFLTFEHLLYEDDDSAEFTGEFLRRLGYEDEREETTVP
jgi:hypothetical protein